MSTIRVVSGILKGKRIPFDNKKFNNADITTQKVKGAVFSMLGDDLSGTAFMDLYGGSGQMGIEALSRGSRVVIINEKDKERYNFLKSFIKEIDEYSQVMLLNLSDYKCLRFLYNRCFQMEYIYVDPPYHKSRSKVTKYYEILGRIKKNDALSGDGIIIVQHYSSNILDEKIDCYKKIKSNEYGNTTISLYRES
ncbi:RsmD family RNA methyltransferase [Spirochaetota bacterium]